MVYYSVVIIEEGNMEFYYSEAQLVDAQKKLKNKNGNILASKIDESIVIGSDNMIIRMWHSEQRGIKLTLKELKTIVAELENIAK